MDYAQQSVASGNDYVVPANGTITQWSTNTNGLSPQSATFKVLRALPNQPGFYSVVAFDAEASLKPGQVNPFTVSIPVQAGDLIALNATSANTNVVNAGVAGDNALAHTPALFEGGSGAFTQISSVKVNLSAQFEPTPSAPSNAFTIVGTALNKKNGTATLNLTLPGPGDLTGSGNGVSAASAGHAQVSKAVGAGPAQLLIKAAGKKKKKLRQNGKVTLSVAVTYTPTGGKPNTQTVSVKLKLKKK